MPFIHTRTSCALTAEQETTLKTRLGQAITLVPGKSEQYLMLDFSQQCHLYFQGDGDKPAAFVEVMLYGTAPDSAYDALTGAITQILSEELGIPASRIYVEYQETSHWGWNGSNF